MASYQDRPFVPMRIQSRKGSQAEATYYRNSGLPGIQSAIPAAIADGVSPAPLEDLIFHGGKLVPKMRFQNVYLGRDASWRQADVDAIDRAITSAMRDRRMNNVMAQYFHRVALECDPIASVRLDEADPVRLDEPDIQTKVFELFAANKIDRRDSAVTIFNLILPPRAVLALGAVNSMNGLGGYHGSVHGTDGGKKITLYYSANVFSEGNNGVVAFAEPWKNVVATLYHELNEFRTDADVKDAIDNRNNDFLGWMSRRGRECGDEPIAVAQSLDVVFQEIVAGADRVPVQFMYSNVVHGPEGPVDAPGSRLSR